MAHLSRFPSPNHRWSSVHGGSHQHETRPSREAAEEGHARIALEVDLSRPLHCTHILFQIVQCWTREASTTLHLLVSLLSSIINPRFLPRIHLHDLGNIEPYPWR